MDCPKCGAYNASSSTHCRRCGQELPVDDDFQERPEPSFTPEEDWSEWRGAAGEPHDESSTWASPEPEPETGGARQSVAPAGGGSGASDYGLPGGKATPSPGPGASVHAAVQSYLWPAVGATLCCCTPLGIPAIVYAARVDAYLENNEHAKAQRASDSARNWLIAAVVVALLVWIVIFVSGTFSSDTNVTTS